MKRLLLFLFIILSGIGISFSQTPILDSLQLVLKTAKEDTNKVNTLSKLSLEVKNYGNRDQAKQYVEKALALAEKLKFKQGIAYAYSQIGNFYSEQDNYSEAMKYHVLSLKTWKETGDKKRFSGAYVDVGNIYLRQGNYPKALNTYYASLKIKEEIGDKKGIATLYNNIGVIYKRQTNYTEALKNQLLALRIREEIEDKKGIGMSYNNIGLIYSDQANYSEAIKNLSAALKINEELEDKRVVAGCYNNLGIVYYDQGNYPEALTNHLAALKINKECKSKYGIVSSMGNLGKLYIKLKKFKEAKFYLNQTLTLSQELGTKDQIKDAFHTLAVLDSTNGNYKQAYEHYKMYILYRDSLINEENTKKTMQASMQYEYDKKAAADSVKHAEEQKVKDAQLTVQKAQIAEEKTQRYALFGGLGLVLIFTGFIFNRFRVIRIQKEVIQEQKETVEQQKAEVEQQKLLVEEKNRDILDSIHYAKRIQEALLKEEEHISNHLPEHFILFQPKDIVSGDFYWGLEKQGHWYLAAADCTGHGVPGAFLTMLGTSFLNEINATDKLLSPAEILNQLRDKFIKELGQTGKDGGSKDGMDVSLIRLKFNDQSSNFADEESQTIELQWAGANNPLWIAKKQQTGEGNKNIELQEIKPNKQPIGYTDNPTAFTNHAIELQQGDLIYIFTDGYADQFGGEKGKKFMYSRFKETLLSISHLSTADQKDKLNEAFNNWKGNLEQIDDVCVIGVRA